MMLNRKRISAKLKLTTKITTNDINNYHKYKKKKKNISESQSPLKTKHST